MAPFRHAKRKWSKMIKNPHKVLRKLENTLDRMGRIANSVYAIGGQAAPNPAQQNNGMYDGGILDRIPGQATRGFGMYEGGMVGDSYNTAYGPKMSAIQSGQVPFPVPMFQRGSDMTGGIVVTKSEYLSDVYCSGFVNPGSLVPPIVAPFPTGVEPFSVKRYEINPALPQTFPWLSQIAQNYDEYEIHELIFTFVSSVSDIGSSANGQCGNVLMVTEYNNDLPNFRNKEDMLMYQGAKSTKTTESETCEVECDPANASGKYTRTAGLPLNKNKFDYDLGVFQIAVSQAPQTFAGQSLGELWVSYTVKLKKPKFYSNKAFGIQQDIFVTSASAIAPSYPMGSTPLLLTSPQNTIKAGLGLSVANNVYITFPASYAGQVEITLNIESNNAYYGYDENTQKGYLSEYKTFGNIKPIYDIYGTGFQVSQGNTQAQTTNNDSLAQWYWITPEGGNGNFVAVVHVTIEAASNGIENTMQIVFDPQWVNFVDPTQPQAFQQSQLTIKEYNTSWSGKANNIGTPGKNEAPILVNTSGIVFIPGITPLVQTNPN